MTKRAVFPALTAFPAARTTRRRTRLAVVAAGVGASVVLGAGVASAEDAAAPSALGVLSPADAVKAQADAQAKAAAAAQKAAAKKAAAAKAAAAKKAAVAPKATDWVAPVKHYALSAGFGLGGNMWSSKHSGQDFAVDTGTDVNTVHGGTVVKAGPNGAGDGPAYGNAIVIQHPNGSYSQYAHLSRIDVNIGEQVKTGEHIAKSGSTGNSSGPHLHFEIRSTPNYGSAVDPGNFMAQHGLKF